MDDWQRKYITENLPELIRWSRFNVLVKAELVAKNILSQADVEKLDALQNHHGQSEISYHYYQLLMVRTNAYKVVTKALIENNQTGAARILFNGVPKTVSDKPMTYLGIPIKLDGLKDMEIEVNGNKLALHEFLPNVNYEKLQKIFQNSVSELEIYDTFVIKQRTFVLAKNTIPSKPPYYVPRLLSNRIKIDESIFKADVPDIFVIKKSLPRYRLSQIAKPNFTDTSTSQVSKITSRFIYLEENDDWIELAKLAKAPIHLINYEKKGNVFLLEDSSAPSNILKKLGSRSERVYMSEVDFVQQQLSEDFGRSSVCICDTPGMGKTLLLANIARLMTEQCAARIFVFIPLDAFCTDYFHQKSTCDSETSIQNVLNYTSNSPQSKDLLLKLIQDKLLLMEIFFDGFDEVPSDKLKLVNQVFSSIATKFPNIRMYITSRPHMREELEKSLRVVAYDILPFNQQNQIDFLTNFWFTNDPNISQTSLQSYATSCLEIFNKSLSKHDKEIAGIPLLCQLIAEVYEDKRAFNAVKRSNFSIVALKISEMYRKFIEKKINFVAKDKKEFSDIKLVHVWHALMLLFPTIGFQEDNLFENVKDLLTSPEILRIGILQKYSNKTLEFIHRTFAEFLVAEYFSTKLHGIEMQKTEEMNCNHISKLELVLACHVVRSSSNFLYPVIASFLNSALGEVSISEEMKNQGATFISSISDKYDFILILLLCCQHNLPNIFSFLCESLRKCDISWILECFTYEYSHQLLEVCIQYPNSEIFHICIKIVTEVVKLDLKKLNTFDEIDTLLQTAVQEANYEAVEYFVDRVSLKNQSLFENCVEKGHCFPELEGILNLLHNKDPTLIHEASDILVTHDLDVREFKILLKFGASLTAVDFDQNCVMNAARHMSASEFYELVQFLLNDLKAEYLFLEDEYEIWKDPLPHIVQYATLLPETLELLLNIPRYDINMKDENGETLLFSAVRGDQLDFFQQLVGRGLDFNARGLENRSLLHVAAAGGGVEMVRHLLSLKLDLNSRDELKRTPLHCAAECRRFSSVEVLVENGASVQAKTNKGQTALHLSAATNCDTSIETIKYLIRKGAEIDDRDNDGNTMLHLCAKKELMACMVELGADIHAKNKAGRTATHLAAFGLFQDSEAIKFLIGKGAGINDRDNDGNTPLHLCTHQKYVLVKMGADIHAKNKKGETPAQKNPEVWKPFEPWNPVHLLNLPNDYDKFFF